MKSAFVLPCAAVFLIAVAGCSEQSAPVPASVATAQAPASAASATTAATAATAAAPVSGPPVTITTLKASKRDMSVNLRATGTVLPLSSVDVRAQMNSTVAKIHVRDGQFVQAGALLLTLDARTEEANVSKARAQVAKAEAALADVRRQFARAQQLLAQNYISQGALDSSQAAVDAQMASLASDQATLDAARVVQSYSRVIAPASGRLGAVNVSVGSAVQANVTPLVTITQLDPIAINFNIPQRNISDALLALKNGGAPVTATLADGGGTFAGRLQFVDNVIDAASGTVKVKAVFANGQGKLWPGAFVEISQTLNLLKDAVVLPQAAIVQSARGTVVYVVEDGKAALRPVKMVYAEGLDAAVTGVKVGELVVLDGKQNLRPGSAVAERTKEPQAAASRPVKP